MVRLGDHADSRPPRPPADPGQGGALPPHAGRRGDRHTALPRPVGGAGGVRRVPPALQRAASAPGAGPGDAGDALPSRAARLRPGGGSPAVRVRPGRRRAKVDAGGFISYHGRPWRTSARVRRRAGRCSTQTAMRTGRWTCSIAINVLRSWSCATKLKARDVSPMSPDACHPCRRSIQWGEGRGEGDSSNGSIEIEAFEPRPSPRPCPHSTWGRGVEPAAVSQ